MGLLDRLHGSDVDGGELSQLLLGYFSSSTEIRDRTQLYGVEAGGSSLTVRYSRKGIAIEMVAGPKLLEDDIVQIERKIRDSLLNSSYAKIARQVLFAHVPTDGWFRFGDVFQIVPVPPEAPRPQVPVGRHPFMLEVRFVSSADMQISMVRQTRALREVELLCAALLGFPISTAGKNAAIGHWVHANPGEVEIKAVYRQEMYTWPGARMQVDTFTPTETLAPLRQIEAQSYYSRFNYSIKDRLDIPTTFEQLVAAYFALSIADREKFSRSAYWFQFARETWSRSRSAAFIAFVSAVEALMDSDIEKQERCETCKQRIGGGPTAKFAELLDRLAPAAAIVPENRKAYYGLRSALTHGDKLLQNDISIWGMGLTATDEQRELRALAQIVQIALHNWLCKFSRDC
jgi:hypothetical protein